MIPFMSMYKLSVSRPEGLGWVPSKGRRMEVELAARWTRASRTSWTILGYFSDSQR